MLLHALPMINMDINQNSIQQLETYPKLLRLVSKVFWLCNNSATHSVRKQSAKVIEKININDCHINDYILLLYNNEGRVEEERCTIIHSHIHA
jgi:hypothetical protein